MEALQEAASTGAREQRARAGVAARQRGTRGEPGRRSAAGAGGRGAASGRVNGGGGRGQLRPGEGLARTGEKTAMQTAGRSRRTLPVALLRGEKRQGRGREEGEGLRAAVVDEGLGGAPARSEERRVGKECRL